MPKNLAFAQKIMAFTESGGLQPLARMPMYLNLLF